MKKNLYLLLLFFSTALLSAQSDSSRFEPLDVFKIEYASSPKINPQGDKVVYLRNRMDIMKDRKISQLWLLNLQDQSHQKLSPFNDRESAGIWSPNGDRLVFTKSTPEGSEIYIYWVSSQRFAQLSQLPASPANISWTPDGENLVFSMKLESSNPKLVSPPKAPKGAKWAKAPRVTDRLKHEADGSGYIQPGYHHYFILPAEGGSPRQLTFGQKNHRSPITWSPDGNSFFFSGNLNEDWEYDFRNSEIYSYHLQTGKTIELTNRKGPDFSPVVSPDGQHIAYLGYDDKVQTYQINRLYIMDLDGGNKKEITLDLDRSLSQIHWSADSRHLFAKYDDKGEGKIAKISLKGKYQEIANQVGGTSIGRPYGGGSYSIAKNDQIAFTHCSTKRPADVALVGQGDKPQRLTDLNKDFLPYRTLGEVEEINYPSSFDNRNIQAWAIYPPFYNPKKKYPLIVEIHGGPITNYGSRFSAELQLMASKDYIVLYVNPRGSTGYGEEFGNLLFNNYPGEDYDDIMDGVDYLLKKGQVDESRLFVTGGSAGGTMTAWIIGKNDRFKGAAVVKPVMNWISKTLVADNYYAYAHYRYKGQPWENLEDYWKFSPISLVEKINTPTMVMVGSSDLRTPLSEAIQLYHALKIRKVETVLVEIPRAYHNIAARPSQLITKINHILAWFELVEEE